MAKPIVEENGPLRSIQLHGWTVTTCKKPILASAAMDALSAELDLTLPEITFGDNYLEINNPKHDFRFRLDPRDALREVEKGKEWDEKGVKVAHAEEWEKGRKAAAAQSTPESVSAVVEKPFDWTYSTCYKGKLLDSNTPSSKTFEPAESSGSNESKSAHPGIPLSKLADTRQPILFYDEVPFFEDELGDNGGADYGVKVRVMPTCIFLLARFFLRVDNVLFRIFDVRWYHEFGTKEVIREWKGREGGFDEVKARLPPENPHDLKPLTDANWVANILGMLGNSPSSLSSSPLSTTARPLSPSSPGPSERVHVSIPSRSPLVSTPLPSSTSAASSPPRQPEQVGNMSAPAGWPGIVSGPGNNKPEETNPPPARREDGHKWKGLGAGIEVCPL